MKMLGALLIVVALSAGAITAQPAELHVLSAGAVRSIVTELAAAYEKETGNPVKLSFGTVGVIRAKLAEAAPADVAIMTDTALNEMTRQGVVREGTWAEVGRTGIGVGVRDGAPKPDIGSEAALKQTLLHARSIAYSDSASGVYVERELFKRLGIEEQMKGKAKMIPKIPVASVVASGDYELGFQQVSELLPVKGAAYVGKIPESLQSVTRFAAGIPVGAQHPKEAKALLEYLASPAAQPEVRSTGLDSVASH